MVNIVPFPGVSGSHASLLVFNFSLFGSDDKVIALIFSNIGPARVGFISNTNKFHSSCEICDDIQNNTGRRRILSIKQVVQIF